MIVDSGMFFLARTGTIDEDITYPVMLDSTDGKNFIKKPGSMEIAGRKVNFPEIVRSENFADFYLDDNNDIAIIADAISLIQRPSKLITRIVEFRKEYGFKPLIYAPGLGDPYLMPALVYAGISIFDDLFTRSESLNGIRYTTLGRTTSDSDQTEKNVEFSTEILDTLSKSIMNGTLRELVEKYTISSRAVEILRMIDLNHHEDTEPYYPSRTPYIKANSILSLYRPDLIRYRNYISSKYRRPHSKSIALILPCTARKPYHLSSTHRKIFSYIEKYARNIHKVVVTSPVGVVPEELEETYPSAFYDIPTIGNWFEDEKTMIRKLLGDYFLHNSYDGTIAFITPDLEFITDILPEGNTTLIGNIKSEQMLKNLKDTLSEIFTKGTPQSRSDYRISKLKSIAEYQFGDWISPYVDEMKPVRSYNQDMLMKDGKAMLVYNQRAGKLTITREMGKIFLRENRFVVQIDDFKPTANIYAMGVLETTGDIRQECEVAIAFEDSLRGVGTAKMHGPAMKNLPKGIAVKVRN